jgi:prepilin-type processing-associated H-X9-DG protein/prepilin-type N-terminal cleavage/methylation domain-containing protein
MTDMRRMRSGFTLLELLVVSGVVALVAALLLPALGQAKARAHRVDCLNRLKQWNMAFMGYAEDNHDLIPRECYEPLGEVTINNWSQVRGRPRADSTTDSDDVWYNALPPLLGQPPAIRFAALAERKNFFDKGHLIHCPAARFPSYALRPTYQFPLFSLAMNSQLINSGPTINVSLIERSDPARIAIFLENRLDGETMVHPAQETTHLGQPAAYANRFGPRHQNGGNLAFADGHVAWFHGRDVVETDESSRLQGGPILPPRDIVWQVYR